VSAPMPVTGPATPLTVRKLTVYCPIAATTLSALARGELDALALDASAAPILRFLEGCPELGALGAYRGVCEVTIGLEAFTPVAGAQPTVGEIGQPSRGATAAITTYAKATLPAERLEALVAEIIRLHPWELPVIELSQVALIGEQRTPAQPGAAGERTRP